MNLFSLTNEFDVGHGVMGFFLGGGWAVGVGSLGFNEIVIMFI